jgi:uncharacterized membrane protein
MTIQPRQITSAERRFILLVDRFIVFVTAHWLLLVILALAIFDGLPILAPVLMHYGITGPAEAIYRVYSFTCHELAYRSYFLFGAQPVYSTEQLQVALGVTNPASDAQYWRDFLGNSQLGFKMAWCERDAAIYTALLLASIFFGWVRTRLKPLNWRAYVLLLVPMAIDGLWQLFTSPLDILPFLPTHESNYILRGITGALFGVGSVWLIYPYLQVAMRDARTDAEAQYQRGKAHQAALNQGH